MITIGIPSYNQAQFLKEAIDSALTQTMLAEIIVVDDGSTDNSLDIARSYGSKIKVISQVNKGLASARNTIIMNMNGIYLLPLDADDILLPNAVERIEDKILETNADIVAPSFRTFGLATQDVIVGPEPIPTVKDFLTANRLGYFSAIRKSKLLEVGGYSPRMNEGFEDWHCWINLLDRGARLVTMSDILVLYRVKQTSMITEAEKHRAKLEAQIKKDFIHLYE